jgi:hypothetical protein
MKRLTKKEQFDFLNWMIEFRTIDTHSLVAWDAVNACINELSKRIYRDASD